MREKHLASPVTVSAVRSSRSTPPWIHGATPRSSVEDVGGSAIRNICLRVRRRSAGRGLGADGRERDVHAEDPVPPRYRDLTRTASGSASLPTSTSPSGTVTGASLRHASGSLTVTGEDTEVDAALERWGPDLRDRHRRSHVDAAAGHLRERLQEVPEDPRPRVSLAARTEADGTYTVTIGVPGHRVPRGAALRLHRSARHTSPSLTSTTPSTGCRPTFVTVNRGRIDIGIRRSAVALAPILARDERRARSGEPRARRITYVCQGEEPGAGSGNGRCRSSTSSTLGVRLRARLATGGSCSEAAGIVTCTYASPLNKRGRCGRGHRGDRSVEWLRSRIRLG